MFPVSGDASTFTYKIAAETTGYYLSVYTTDIATGLVSFGYNVEDSSISYLHSFFTYVSKQVYLGVNDSTLSRGGYVKVDSSGHVTTVAQTSGAVATLVRQQSNEIYEQLNPSITGGLYRRNFSNPTWATGVQYIVAATGTWGMFESVGMSTDGSHKYVVGYWDTSNSVTFYHNQGWAGALTAGFVCLHATGGNMVIQNHVTTQTVNFIFRASHN